MSSGSEQGHWPEPENPVDSAAYNQAGAVAEFLNGWPILVGANLGIAVGVAVTPAVAISVVMPGLQTEFGWSRGQISVGPSLVFFILALMSPLVGWAVDRFKAAAISMVGLAGLGAAFLVLSRIDGHLLVYYIACVIIALFGAGTVTIPYARAISAAFVRSRGLALGLAMVGSGLGVIVWPLLLAPLAAHLGWRLMFVILAGIIFASAPAVGSLVNRAPYVHRPPVHLNVPSRLQPNQVRVFLIMGAAFLFISLALTGLFLHLLPLLTDDGVRLVQASWIVAAVGAVQIVARVLCGWLVDRLFAPRVAAVLVTMAAICLTAFAILGARAAILAPLGIGLAFGAEIDLVGYLTARYFTPATYGRVYGSLYSISLIGSSASSLLYGAIFDAARGYAPALVVSVVLLLSSSMLFLKLPNFEAFSSVMTLAAEVAELKASRVGLPEGEPSLNPGLSTGREEEDAARFSR